jgi:hypothetical protein
MNVQRFFRPVTATETAAFDPHRVVSAGLPYPDTDREPVAQVRVRPPQRGVAGASRSPHNRAHRLAGTFTPANSFAVLVEASRTATPSETTPAVLADAGAENVNAQVDELITAGVLRRLLAFTDLKFSNSMIEAWWRSLKHQWLFLHSLDSLTTVRRLIAFYVQEHNTVLPHSAFRGQTPDEMYFGNATRRRE